MHWGEIITSIGCNTNDPLPKVVFKGFQKLFKRDSNTFSRIPSLQSEVQGCAVGLRAETYDAEKQ